jgi:hypothetical protein
MKCILIIQLCRQRDQLPSGDIAIKNYLGHVRYSFTAVLHALSRCGLFLDLTLHPYGTVFEAGTLEYRAVGLLYSVNWIVR